MIIIQILIVWIKHFCFQSQSACMTSKRRNPSKKFTRPPKRPPKTPSPNVRLVMTIKRWCVPYFEAVKPFGIKIFLEGPRGPPKGCPRAPRGPPKGPQEPPRAPKSRRPIFCVSVFCVVLSEGFWGFSGCGLGWVRWWGVWGSLGCSERPLGCSGVSLTVF